MIFITAHYAFYKTHTLSFLRRTSKDLQSIALYENAQFTLNHRIIPCLCVSVMDKQLSDH
jgi:hypothetical protein